MQRVCLITIQEDHPPDFAPHDYDHSDGIQEDENTFQGRDNTPALSIVNEDEDTLPEEHEANIPQPYHDHGMYLICATMYKT